MDNSQQQNIARQETIELANDNSGRISDADINRWYTEKRRLSDQLKRTKKLLVDAESTMKCQREKFRRQSLKFLDIKRKNMKLRSEMIVLSKKIFETLSDVSSESDPDFE